MSKITAYSPMTSIAGNDLLPIVDVDNTSMAASGTTMNVTVANLLAAGAPSDWFNVKSPDYGALGNGVADDTAAIRAAVTACIAAGGGTVYLPGGTYKTTSTITANVTGVAVYILGAGNWATTISYYGSGDCLRIYSTTTTNGGGVQGLTIDGANSSGSAASAGLHMGDVFRYHVNLAAQNFNNFAGSIGVHFDNQNYWTEQLTGAVYTYNCLAGVVFDHGSASTCSGSYDRIDMLLYISQGNPASDGVVLQNGSYWVDGAVAVRGNFVTSGSALTSAILRITGTAPGGTVDAGTYSSIQSCRLDIGTETDGGLANGPYSIYFGTPTSGNSIRNSYGVMDFGGGAVRSTNSANSITWSGFVNGDSSITSSLVLSFATLSTVLYVGASTTINGTAVSTETAYLGNATLAASTKGNLASFPPDGNTYQCGQYLVQASSATAGTTGTTSQNISGLVTPTLGAGSEYYVEITVPWESTGTVGSHTTWGMSAGGGLTLTAISMASLIIPSDTTAEGGTSALVTSTTLSDAMWTGPTVAATAGYGLARFWGTVTVNAAGTLQMVFANATSADTVTMGAGATILIRPLS